MAQRYWQLGLTAIVCALSLASLFPIGQRIRLGLDLLGGVELRYLVDVDEGSGLAELERQLTLVNEENKQLLLNRIELIRRSHTEAIAKTLTIVRQRVDRFGLKAVHLRQHGHQQVVVQLAGVDQEAVRQIRALIERQGELALHLVSGAREGARPDSIELPLQGGAQSISVDAKPFVTGDQIAYAYWGKNEQGERMVVVEFDPDGRAALERATRENVGARMAIVLDGVVQNIPKISRPIESGRAVLRGKYTDDQVDSLVAMLQIGSLPARFQLESQDRIGPTLGREAIFAGVIAALAALVLVVLFLLVYSGWLGVVASAALVVITLIVLAFAAAFGTPITLPGMAAMILTLGMAVDAHILLVERIRDERRAGKELGAAIAVAYKRTTRTILDTNLTTLITAMFLIAFGNGAIRGYAILLALGIGATLFSVLVVMPGLTSLIERRTRGPALTKRWLTKRVDFCKAFPKATLLSLLCVAVAGTVFFTRGRRNLDVDLRGGTIFHVRCARAMTRGEVRDLLADQGLFVTGSALQRLGTIGERAAGQVGLDFTVEIPSDHPGEAEAARQAIARALPLDASDPFLRELTVGPLLASEMQHKALYVVLAALLATVLYITVRFEWRFAIAAILTLLHDVVIVLGALAIAGRPINLTMVAAILTIIGYSLNDTIVVFDRIREQLSSAGGAVLSRSVVNDAINGTLSRTLHTSFTTGLVAVTIYLVADGLLQSFAFAILVGVGVGTYSSVFVATPLLLLGRGRAKPAQVPEAGK